MYSQCFRGPWIIVPKYYGKNTKKAKQHLFTKEKSLKTNVHIVSCQKKGGNLKNKITNSK